MPYKKIPVFYRKQGFSSLSFMKESTFMNASQLKNSFLLLLTAVIWGVAFVAQSVGMDYVGPCTFTMTRNLIGGAVLIPYILLASKRRDVTSETKPTANKTLWIGGACCGLCLAIASILQQTGMQYTTVGRAGFITACYIVLVPILHMLCFRKRCRPIIWFCVILSIIGLYLLCMQGSFALGKGELLVLLCAVVYAIHILTIDHFAPHTDCVKMACIQFFVCAVICAVPAFLFEHPQIETILQAWMPILYAGVLSSGVGYTLQIVGQKGMNPTVASLLLSMESCFSVIAGWILLQQKLSAKELLGCILMFAAIVLAQLPSRK